MTKIAIVGGGLSGISTARHAIANGFEVELFEAQDHLGGRLSHRVIDSCVVDRGFQVVNVKYPELRRLLPSKKVASRALFTNLSFLDDNGIRRDVSPMNIPSLLSPASGSLLQKFRFLGFLFSKSDASQSLYTRSKSFKDLYEKVLSPFLSGVFLTDPKNIRGDVAQHVLRYFLMGRPHLIDGGVGNLIPALIEGISTTNLHPNSKVVRITQDQVTKQLTLKVQSSDGIAEFENFDFAVIATNGAAGEIQGSAGGNSRQWIASTTVYHKVNKLPQANRKLFLGSSFVNSLVASDANSTYSDSQSSLIATTYLGEISDSMWQENRIKYEKEIADLYDCTPEGMKLVSIERVAKSLPLFSPLNLSDSVKGQLAIVDPENTRILYAGDAFDEPSQNGALRSGRLVIEKILQVKL